MDIGRMTKTFLKESKLRKKTNLCTFLYRLYYLSANKSIVFSKKIVIFYFLFIFTYNKGARKRKMCKNDELGVTSRNYSDTSLFSI